MIFDLTKAYVPESYIDSRDYRVFLRQLGTVLTVAKYNIDHFPDLYDADDCPEHLLPLLATMVGYKYRGSLSVDSNRKIIKYFPYLIRNRGSELGIKLAVALSINTDPSITKVYSMDSVIVESDPDSGVITIYYPRVDVVDWELIEVVRPVGMRIRLIQSDNLRSVDELDVKVIPHFTRRNQYFDQSIVDQSQVGYDINKITREVEEDESSSTND